MAELTERQQQIKDFADEFIFFREEIRKGTGDKPVDDMFITQLFDQLTRMRNTETIQRSRQSAGGAGAVAKERAVAKEAPAGRTEKRGEPPAPCRDCRAAGGQSGTYCTEYKTHLWNAIEKCKADMNSGGGT